MIVDAETDRSALDRAFDVCVIGTGPAGITLARKLAAAGARVALMEGGGEDYAPRSQNLYKGQVAGLDYWPLDQPRLRLFGGSSNHWAGWSRALDALDFAPRAHVPLSGWPIAKADLDPYAAETEGILELPPEPDLPPVIQSTLRFHRFAMRYSPPTRFGDRYRDALQAAPTLVCALNANLVDLRLDDGLGRVAEAAFRSYAPDDPGFRIRARRFCLCTGGIENARLLLNFTSQRPEGLGNRHGLVGRHFCEHPHFTVADALLGQGADDLEFYRPRPEFAEAADTLNFGLRLEPARFNPPGAPPREDIADCDAALTASLVAAIPADSALHRGLLARARANGCPTATVRVAQEQALNPDSRVMLGDGVDALGLRRSRLDWRLTRQDRRSMRTAALAFALHMAEQDRGRLRIRDWLLSDDAPWPDLDADEVAGKHHMCTTRMAADPRRGVVDADCRVHGIDNLYIGGSSVFATGGHANPTYTIVQLALRLADHLHAIRD
ncbi:GMC family oxidoreductase [Rhodobacteraceae bacterium 2CG4]|uniref:GMC family oxidoreductase n=1 Tax=Halovulum marinum TaxID=2662447 RepID=A0A6L5Z0V9_9RHOB|nr:GMC family oxidoreductase [Halovulum marinum]MSU90193.1 GMC family oxidoreductase [Halovulum marinum]